MSPESDKFNHSKQKQCVQDLCSTIFSLVSWVSWTRKISIRISAAIKSGPGLFYDAVSAACPAVATPARAWYLRRHAEHIAPGARHSPVEPCEAHSVQRRCRAAVCAAVRADRGTAFLPFQHIPCIRARWQIDFSHGLVFRQSSFLLQVTVCSASPRAGHRKGQDNSGSPFVKLLQPTLKTRQRKTSSVSSNNKEIWREASSPAYTVKSQTEEHKVI